MSGVRSYGVNRGAKASRSENIAYNKKENRSLSLQNFSCGEKKGIAHLQQWIKDNVICLLEVEVPSFYNGLETLRFYPYHRKERHKFE